MNNKKEKREIPKGTFRGMEYGIYKDKAGQDWGKVMVVTPKGLRYFKTYKLAKTMFDLWMNK